MDTDTFDRFTRLFSLAGTRRSVLTTMIGIALLESGLGSATAKPKPERRRQPNGMGASNRNGTRRGKRLGRLSAQGKTKTKRGNHCIGPSGHDLNERYGISAQIVAPFCNAVGSGERWVNVREWLMSPDFDVVPEDFVPAGATPLADFLAKFEGVTYVIDPGTKHEKTVAFPSSEKLFVGKEDGFDLVSPGTLGAVHPLPVGKHVVDVYWRFSALHCDGFGDDPTPAANCFPAGKTKYVSGLAFTVTPGHH